MLKRIIVSSAVLAFCCLPLAAQEMGGMHMGTVAERAGWKAGEIRSKMFRHTYCAARLQTLDQGAPVSIYTVARELGHGGDSMVKRVYGHLGTVRHRAEAVEYRVDQQKKTLGDRLAALQPTPAFVTTIVTMSKSIV